MRVIEVSVKDCSLYIPYKELKAFQGDLKKIEHESVEKLKKAIIRVGFCFPVFVWRNDGDYHLIDGHQRKIALTSLDADGWTIPKIPAVEIVAESINDAREKLLYATSQFGEFNTETAQSWLESLDSSVSDLVRLVDTELTLDLDFDLSLPEENNGPEPEPKVMTCPECGCQF